MKDIEQTLSDQAASPGGEGNEAEAYQQTLGKWIGEEWDRLEWRDEESKQRAIDTDSIWVIPWNPCTPNGNVAIAAPTLEELLEFAKSIDE